MVRDWEKEIVDLTDRIRRHPDDADDIVEELVDVVEDMILTAYTKGVLNGEKKNKSKNG